MLFAKCLDESSEKQADPIFCSITDIIKTISQLNEEYIVKTLSQYTLATGSKDVYDLITTKYPELEIYHISSLSTENLIYLVNKHQFDIRPITLVYDPIQYDFDACSRSYKAYSRVHLEAGSFIL